MHRRRLKHWGWGFEDQASTTAQLAEAAAGIRERFGFGGEVRAAVPLEEVEVRGPRLRRPDAFGDLFTDAKYERASRALGKAYRDIVRGHRGRRSARSSRPASTPPTAGCSKPRRRR